MPNRILVVDSEAAITGAVAPTLAARGFDVHTVGSGREALQDGPAFRPDLVLIGINLDDGDGLAVLRRLRDNAPGVGAILLTSEDGAAERVRALAEGGDDCVAKPVDVEELVARVGAVLRRTSGAGGGPGGPGGPVTRLAFADLELDDATREVWRDGQPVRLTATEFNMLRYLLLNQGVVVSKAQILDRLWPHDFDGDDNVVETYISYLRRKVDRGRTPLIHTVRGSGYVLRAAR